MPAPPRLRFLQCIGECLRIDERAAGGVDQHGIRFHAREPFATDQVACRVGERAVQGQHVELGQQVVEIPASCRGRTARTIGDLDAHSEGARDLGRRAAECAESDDPEYAALQFADRIGKDRELSGLLPAAACDQRVVVGETMRQREEHRKDVLNDRGRAVIAEVTHRNAAFACGGEIDVVDAGRRQAR